MLIDKINKIKMQMDDMGMAFCWMDCEYTGSCQRGYDTIRDLMIDNKRNMYKFKVFASRVRNENLDDMEIYLSEKDIKELDFMGWIEPKL